MKEFFSPYQTLYHTNLGLSNQVYNLSMSPRHFANLYSERSHRHDSKRDIEIFHDDMQTITGMLYSIVTLKAFFPFFKSPAKISDAVGYGLGGTSNAPYPMPQIAGDKEEQNNPI